MKTVQEHTRDISSVGSDTPLRWIEFAAGQEVVQQAWATIDDIELKAVPRSWRSGTRGCAIVAGNGAVGGVAMEALSRAGLREVIAVDPDIYGNESFLTQPSSWRDAGKQKACVQAARAHAANPTVRVRAAVGEAQDLPFAVLRKASVIVAAGDNLDMLLWAGRAGLAFGIPLVQAAVHGETATAIVRGYALHDPAATCPRCTLGQRELELQQSRLGCDPFTSRRAGAIPTRTLPMVCAVAGQWAATEAFKWVAGLEAQALQGEEYAQSQLTYHGWRTTLPRNPTCEHMRWEIRDLPRLCSQTTLAILAAELGSARYGHLLQVRSEVPWISFAICPACARQVGVRRFAWLGSRLGNCVCGAALQAGPQGSYSVLPGRDLRKCWEQSLADLGLEDQAVGLQCDEQWVYFFLGPNAGPEQGAEGKK